MKGQTLIATAGIASPRSPLSPSGKRSLTRNSECDLWLQQGLTDVSGFALLKNWYLLGRDCPTLLETRGDMQGSWDY